MSNDNIFEVQGLTDFRFKLSETIKALMEDGKTVKVHAYGLDRKPKGVITLNYESFDNKES